ncbi:hypothetical protein ABEB36_015611 [Hypothenemus hampei]|uniref:Uncharacterized protein n=1 Tax=Hypothenemus hampei TaxID=57062 RepID=A0ABD1DZ85_HYPHA
MHNSVRQPMCTPSDLRIVVSEVLQSEEFCNQLRCSIEKASSDRTSQLNSIQQRRQETPATTPVDELRRLFPSIRGPNNPEMTRRSFRSGHTFEKMKSRKINKIVTSDFQKDIILLKSETIAHTLSGYKKSWAYENCRNIYGFCLCSSNIEKLQGVKFEILIPMNRHLVKLNLPKGTTLDGTIMRQLFNQKVVYVRPLSKITDEKECFENDDNDVHVNGSDEILKSSAPKNNEYTGIDLRNNQSVLPSLASNDNILMELHDSDLIELEFLDDDLDVALASSLDKEKKEETLIEALKALHNKIDDTKFSHFNIQGVPEISAII